MELQLDSSEMGGIVHIPGHSMWRFKGENVNCWRMSHQEQGLFCESSFTHHPQIALLTPDLSFCNAGKGDNTQEEVVLGSHRCYQMQRLAKVGFN